jgi:hypothetical protein
MLKSAIVAASVFLATAAVAQSDTKKGPGQSEFAPGHQTNTKAGPGHSESAPGQQAQQGRTGPF